VEDEKKLIVSDECKDRNVSGGSQRIERIWANLIQHIDPMTQHLGPGRADARKSLDNDLIDRRSSQIVVVVRHELRLIGSYRFERAGTRPVACSNWRFQRL